MPRSTSTGVYTAPSNSFNPAVTNTVINTAAWNATQADYVTALAHAASTTRALYPTTAQVQDGALLWGGTAGGTADALTITLTPAITAYVTGQIFQFIAAFANLTATPTVNINGAGAVIIKRQNGSAIQASDISANAVVQLAYNGTNFLLTSITVGQATPLSVISYSGRTSNTVLGVSDRGYFVDITSGTFSQTFTAAATLGSGWYVYLRNNGTGDITLDPNASELIDGLATYVMYQGETRLIQCNGTAFTSVVLSPFYRAFTSTGTFVQPPGYTAVGTNLVGAGGGGGGGAGAAAAALRQGGCGGGGGVSVNKIIISVTAGASTTVTIGAGGAGGAGGIIGIGSAGSVGGTSSFGTSVYAYGGGGGSLGSSGDRSGGSGGGTGGAGAVGGTANTVGGLPSFATNGGATEKNNFGGGGAAGRIGAATGFAEYGGGAGGSTDSFNSVFTGGGSIFGGGGGGSGGSVSSGNVASVGSAGGATSSYAAGGGGAGGAATGAAGTAGGALTGGGGGGGNTAGTGGAGGTAGVGGGGGGGAGGTTTGGAGGAGGAGQIIVWGVA